LKALSLLSCPEYPVIDLIMKAMAVDTRVEDHTFGAPQFQGELFVGTGSAETGQADPEKSDPLGKVDRVEQRRGDHSDGRRRVDRGDHRMRSSDHGEVTELDLDSDGAGPEFASPKVGCSRIHDPGQVAPNDVRVPQVGWECLFVAYGFRFLVGDDLPCILTSAQPGQM
jgi:hypothetical protein